MGTTRPRARGLRALLAASAGLVALHGPTWTTPVLAAQDELRGVVVRVRDGDTLELAGRVVRLLGVAAPELHEPLGAKSREALERLVAGRPVACEPDGSRSHGRIVAICRVAGEDIGGRLIAEGLARDCPRFSLGRYASLERAAAARGARIRELYPLPAYCLVRSAGR